MPTGNPIPKDSILLHALRSRVSNWETPTENSSSPKLKRVYLNNAAGTFPKPAEVVDAVRAELEAEPADGRRRSLPACRTDPVETCRAVLSEFFNSAPEEIILTSGATFSLNLVVRGLLSDGGHVIAASVDHNSVLRPLSHLEQAGTISLTLLHCGPDGAVDPEDLRRALRGRRTRAVFLNHASNVTGAVNAAEEIVRAAGEAGALSVIDASQTAGILSLDAMRLRPDVLVFAGHKYLFGPEGTGGLYLRRGLELAPLVTGGTGVRSESRLQPEERPYRYEAGTPNRAGFAGLAAGVRWVQSRGIESLARRTDALTGTVLERLSGVSGLLLYGPQAADQRVPVVSFTLSGWTPGDLGMVLDESFGITVRSGLHCAPLIHKDLGTYPEGTVRVSLSPLNKEEDILYFTDAVGRIAEGRRGPD